MTLDRTSSSLRSSTLFVLVLSCAGGCLDGRVSHANAAGGEAGSQVDAALGGPGGQAGTGERDPLPDTCVMVEQLRDDDCRVMTVLHPTSCRVDLRREGDPPCSCNPWTVNVLIDCAVVLGTPEPSESAGAPAVPLGGGGSDQGTVAGGRAGTLGQSSSAGSNYFVDESASQCALVLTNDACHRIQEGAERLDIVHHCPSL
jgi:hypothetical protein